MSTTDRGPFDSNGYDDTASPALAMVARNAFILKSQAHEAYIEFIIKSFKQIYNRTMLPEEAVALAEVHSDNPTSLSNITNCSYFSFVDDYIETQTLEPHLSMMKEDIARNNLDERTVEWLSRDLVKAGWQKVYSEDV